MVDVHKQVRDVDISKQVAGRSTERVVDNMVGKPEVYTVPRKENYTTEKGYRWREK